MALFDPLAAGYDQWCTTPLGSLTAAYEQAVLAELLPPDLAGRRVLDIGCGTGTWPLFLAGRGAAVTGIDLSAAMVQAARRKAAATGQAGTFLTGDARQLPFPAGSFDLVSALLVLEFAAEPAAVLAEMARVLRPGGIAVVAALNRYSIWAALRRIQGWLRPSLWRQARFYTPGGLAAMLSQAGLVPVARRAAVYYPPIAAARARPLLAGLEALGRRGCLPGPAFLAVRAEKPPGPGSAG